jgi:hypothetical protein
VHFTEQFSSQPTIAEPVIEQPQAAPPIVMTAMNQTASQLPIDAEIALTKADGGAGTWVAMRCYYEKGYNGSWPVRLVVFPVSGGDAEQIGTWLATSGQAVELNSLTHLAPSEIARVELQGANQQTLLWWTPT